MRAYLSILIESMKNILKTTEGLLGAILILVGVSLAIVFIIIASNRNFSNLETTLFQILILIFSIIGSILFGRQSAKKYAQEMIKPHARSAFRRVFGLYQSFYRLLEVTNETNFDKEDTENNKDMQLEIIKAILIEQTKIAGDSLEDWRDLIPEDIEELERKVHERSINKT